MSVFLLIPFERRSLCNHTVSTCAQLFLFENHLEYQQKSIANEGLIRYTEAEINAFGGKTMLKRKITMSLFGVIVCAVAVGIFKIAALGVDPFQSFMSGLDKLIPIEFGTLYVIVNACLLLFSLIADRTRIGLATFINLFLLGYITQYTYEFLQTVVIDPSLTVRFICLAAGIVIICFGSALYMTADLGVSTYDAVAIVLSGKWHWGKFQYVRIGCDIVCVVLGTVIFLVGGGTLREIPTVAGIGTIITAFFMGPLIEFFNVKIARPLLQEKKSV